MKKKLKLQRITPLLLGTCMLTFFAACGSDDDDNSSSSTPPTEQEQQQDGQYRVVLAPINTNVAGTATGTAEFTISGDEFRSMVNVTGAPAGEHMQFVQIGNACATPAADTNGDGFVDFVEATAVSGQALIPLDDDLNSQLAGAVFPSGESYNYDQSASLSAMLADLRLPDSDTSDILTKLGPTDDLNLEGKVVQIHGVPATTVLPPTVQSAGGMSPQQTLPILCGVIIRSDGGTGTGTTTGGTGTTTGGTGTTTGGTGTTTGGTGTTTGGTGTTTGGTGTTTGGTGTDSTTGGMGTTTGSGSENVTSF